MEEITFNDLPKTVANIYNIVQNLERLLLGNSKESQPDSDQFLTITEAGAFLHLSVSTLYGYVHLKVIPSYKRGKHLYFKREELINWITEGRKKTLKEISTGGEQYLKKMKKRNILQNQMDLN